MSKPDFNSINRRFLDDSSLQTFIEKLKSIPPAQRKEFSLDGDRLFYFGLEVVPRSRTMAVLEDLYKNDTNVIGKSTVSLYKYVQTKYANIKRTDIQTFLASQKGHQMAKGEKKIIRRPIIARYPNQIWMIDLPDVSSLGKSNYGWNWIFVCVDIFSRYCWLERLKVKEAKETTRCLKAVIERAKVQCKQIRSDNGQEWMGEFAQFCEDKGIPVIKSQSHSPTQQSVVERVNKSIRSIMRFMFVRNGNKKWYDKLPEMESSKNNEYNGRLKAIPNQVWTPTVETELNNLDVRILPKNLETRQVRITRAELLQHAMKAKAEYETADNFRVGDKVRLLMSKCFVNQRKVEKSGVDKKKLVVTWTPLWYIVSRVISGGKIGHKTYEVYNDRGMKVQAQKKGVRFKAGELLLVEEPAPPNGNSQREYDKALKLNGIERASNDLYGL